MPLSQTVVWSSGTDSQYLYFGQLLAREINNKGVVGNNVKNLHRTVHLYQTTVTKQQP